MSCSVLLSHFQARRDNIHGNDLLRSFRGEFSSHDGSKANSTSTNNGNTGVRIRLDDVQHGAGSCHDATAQRSEQLKRCIGRHLDDTAFRGYAVPGHTRLAKEM